MSSPRRKNGKALADGSEIQNEVISIAVPEVDEDPLVALHPGVACCGPHCPLSGKWIHGVRYKCSVCQQQDFCRSCVGQPDNGHDASHPLYECIGPSEFIEARLLTTGELVFPKPPADGLPELLAINNLCLNGEDPKHEQPLLPTLPLRYIPKSYCGLSLGNVEHYQDAGLLARVILGQITKYDYSDCQLKDFPGHQPAVARLLELKPGNPGDKIECGFKLTRLESGTPYEVLAFKLRSLTSKTPSLDDVNNLLLPERKHAVYVGDKHFLEASSAVFDTLQAARDPTEAKLFWIEELCVDPAHEKRFQNRSRGLIVRAAANVLVQGGDVHDGIEDMFGLMTMLTHYCNGDSTSLPTPHQVDEHGLPALESEEWHSLLNLFTQAVVHYQWQADELSFARDPVLQIGEYHFNWWDVIGIINMLRQDAWSGYLRA